MWLNDSEADYQPRARIDLTPMIGVLAALLAIFALAIPPATRDLPVGTPAEGIGDWFAPPPRDLDVRVTADGALTIEGQPMSADAFDSFVTLEQARARTPVFHLRLARRAHYQSMAMLLDTLQRHDVRYFDFKDDAR